MTGYMFVLGTCWSCGNTFTFNADWVPSISVRGVKQPICLTCMERANEQRKAAGLPPHPIHPDAYEAGEVA